MKKIVILSLLLLAAVPGCRTAELINPDPVSVTASPDSTRAVLLEAMNAQSWAVSEEAPGRIEAVRIVKGRHEMHVDLLFDQKHVSMKYASSKNLAYSKGLFGTEHIHKNYNAWTGNLWWEITRRLSQKRLSETGDPQ